MAAGIITAITDTACPAAAATVAVALRDTIRMAAEMALATVLITARRTREPGLAMEMARTFPAAEATPMGRRDVCRTTAGQDTARAIVAATGRAEHTGSRGRRASVAGPSQRVGRSSTGVRNSMRLASNAATPVEATATLLRSMCTAEAR